MGISSLTHRVVATAIVVAGVGFYYLFPLVASVVVPYFLAITAELPAFSFFYDTLLPLASLELLGASRVGPPSTATSHTAFTCVPHAYTTTIISIDPLVIYIHNFTSPLESSSIIRSGTPNLTASPVTGSGDGPNYQARTSHSAPLDATDAAVSCVLSRAQRFMGPTALLPGRDDIGTPQMVKYTTGQKFDLHMDWFARPRVLDADVAVGRRRLYNRAATIFAVLECTNCTGGETWFPRLKPVASLASQNRQKGASSSRAAAAVAAAGGGKVDEDRGDRGEEDAPAWREHADGGLAFRPMAGNAVFWVNLFPNGTGDSRVLHAGLPVGEGSLKTAMNIWPRTFFGPDA